MSILAMVMAVSVGLDRGWGAPVAFCSISDKAITESSGLASSRLGPGVFYTHNDSGDSARFFRFDKSGAVTGTFSLAGVKATDWEEMASAKVRSKAYLYLADVGDNNRVRKEVYVYRLAEPEGAGREIRDFETLTLKYPDKARDCEGMFADPGSGDIYLVIKARDRETVVYRVKNPSGTGAYTMEKLGNLTVKLSGLGGNLVTGAAVSPDGKHVVVRTYSDALEYDVPAVFEDWIKAEPRVIKLPVEKQGEAICYSLDGGSLLTTSEGSPCPVSRVPLKSR